MRLLHRLGEAEVAELRRQRNPEDDVQGPSSLGSPIRFLPDWAAYRYEFDWRVTDLFVSERFFS